MLRFGHCLIVIETVFSGASLRPFVNIIIDLNKSYEVDF